MTKLNTFLINKSSGFSLIEVIVISGILSIIGLAMLTLTTNLQKQNKGLQQKLEAIQIEQSLTRLMTDNNSCQCMFANMSLGNDGTTTNITNNIRAGCSTESLVAVNSPVPNTSTGLRVSTIELTDVKTIDANKKLANIVISFDNKSLASPLAPVKLKGQSFLMTGSQISQCVGVLGTIEMCTSMGGQWTNGACQTQIKPSSACTSLGGVWSNNNCQISAKPQETCSAMGGTWTGTSCTVANSNTQEIGTWKEGYWYSTADEQIPLCDLSFRGRYCTYTPPSTPSCKMKIDNYARSGKSVWYKLKCLGPASPPVFSGPSMDADSSDIRLKKDIHAFSAGLKEALRIQPFQFKYNGLGGTQDDRKTYTGVMAQDLEKIIPGLVRYRKAKLHPEDEEPSVIRSVDYQGITFVLLNSVKEQQGLIEKQQRQMEEDRRRLSTTEKHLQSLEQKLKSLEKKINLSK